MADNSLPKVAETALPDAAMENVTHLRVVSTDNSEKLPIDNLTIAGTKVTVAVEGISGTVDGAFGDVLTAIAGKADTTQVEALDDVDEANYAKSVEMIAHNATAPSPVIPTGTTKTYEFSSGGVCAWLANQVVEKGDKATVAFTAPSTFVRTYQDIVSRKVNTTDIEQVRSQATNKVASSKLLDDELTKVTNTERPIADIFAHLLGRIETLEQIIAASVYNAIQVNELSVVNNIKLKGADLILFGTAAPVVTPDFVGQFFVNTTEGVTYQAKGIVNSGDWKQTSN